MLVSKQFTLRNGKIGNFVSRLVKNLRKKFIIIKEEFYVVNIPVVFVSVISEVRQ